jgi:hypothetical protein
MFDKTPKAFWGERPRRSIRRPSGQGRKQAKACFRQSHLLNLAATRAWALFQVRFRQDAATKQFSKAGQTPLQ